MHNRDLWGKKQGSGSILLSESSPPHATDDLSRTLTIIYATETPRQEELLIIVRGHISDVVSLMSINILPYNPRLTLTYNVGSLTFASVIMYVVPISGTGKEPR